MVHCTIFLLMLQMSYFPSNSSTNWSGVCRVGGYPKEAFKIKPQCQYNACSAFTHGAVCYPQVSWGLSKVLELSPYNFTASRNKIGILPLYLVYRQHYDLLKREFCKSKANKGVFFAYKIPQFINPNLGEEEDPQHRSTHVTW